MKRYLLISAFLLLASASFAQEGMWLLSQIGQLDLNKKGLLIPVEKIYSPGKPCLADAVIQLDGGTASFVSPDGLIFTNHHVAYAALQRASSVTSDYLTNGFLAGERSSEIQAPGYEARLMVDMKDVTDELIKAAKGITDPVESDKKIREKISSMTEAVREKTSDKEAEIVSLFEGRQYMMYTYKVFRDVRLVYSPPLSIGFYGGDADNFMWPRHTGDFAFLRAYVNNKGEGADYSPDNVPYHPQVWLKPSSEDIDEGDFNFIIGFPGRTVRYRSSSSVDWNLNRYFPYIIRQADEIISICKELTGNDPAGKLKVASLIFDLENGRKSIKGNVEGMIKTGFLQQKLAFEKEFIEWVNSTPERKSEYADILSGEKAEYEKMAKTFERSSLLGLFNGFWSGIALNVAVDIYRFSRELEKPEKEREPGLIKETLKEYAEGLQNVYSDYYEPVDRAMLLRLLKMADALQGEQRIAQLDPILKESGMSPEQWTENAYASSRMKDPEFAAGLVGKSTAQLAEMNDPIMKLAVALFPAIEESEKISEVFNAKVNGLRKKYIEALCEWKGTAMYPDANGTIRFAWGPIKGYRPADAVLNEPFTTLQGVIEKNTGIAPFNAPAGLIRLREARDFGRWIDPELGDVPVAFLNQCDITGGNSGSPVMNAMGELIGIVFDSNWEALNSDWQYDNARQRCIAVDFRYVMFITEKFGNASFLLKEMEIN